MEKIIDFFGWVALVLFIGSLGYLAYLKIKEETYIIKQFFKFRDENK